MRNRPITFWFPQKGKSCVDLPTVGRQRHMARELRVFGFRNSDSRKAELPAPKFPAQVVELTFGQQRFNPP
jgi:hypothetical protein